VEAAVRPSGQKDVFAMKPVSSSTLRVVAYTDGASSHNQNAEQRRGGWGIVLTVANEQGEQDARPAAYKELSGTLPGATNNQAELEAIKQALLALKHDGVVVTIMTDSQYAIGVLSKAWKPKQNQVLIEEIKSLMSKHSVTFEKVAGHSGVAHNTRADALAVAATKA
jgi:ribonuclease HI